LPVSIPVGGESGSDTLVLGATGSGKTVTETWIATRLVEHGHGAVVIDPKGDPLLHQALAQAAQTQGRRFLEWSPQGPCSYNPYGHGGDTEIADKALVGELFTEPHYLRQAQRYLGHAVRAMRQADVPINPVSLVAQLDPHQLEVTARALPEDQAAALEAYLDAFSDRQRRDLAGVRDRLSILAESDTSPWLTENDETEAIDLLAAVAERAVVYFALDADRRPLLSQMLAGAIVSDLVTLVAGLQREPVATVVVIDEFAAVAASHVARLFGRARSAGISLLLGTQELADLKTVGEGLREQVLGNVSTLVAHRQNVPESAELIAGIAGTKPVWVTTDQTEEGLFGHGHSGRGTRRRGYEYALHADRIKQLATGSAAVITPGSGRLPVVARMHHPQTAAR
jgi:conjugal transfer pilus assembly protein TraD